MPRLLNKKILFILSLCCYQVVAALEHNECDLDFYKKRAVPNSQNTMPSTSSKLDSEAVAPKIENFNNLNLNIIKEILLEAYPKVQMAEGKDIVLVIGNTGAGKSTFINYLLGHKMYKVFNDDDGMDYAQCDAEFGSICAKMGESLGASKTLYPELFAEGSFCYCDTPGFKDNRGEEEKICTVMTTQLMVNKAKNVKVIVLIDENSFNVARGSDFVQLSETLSNLFYVTADLSLLFVINKAPPGIEAHHILKRINGLINREETFKSNFLSLLPKNIILAMTGQYKEGDVTEEERQEAKHKFAKVQEEVSQKDKMLRMLDFMRSENGRYIHVVNIFDDQEGADAVRTALSSMQFLDRNVSFNFNGFDSARYKFKEALRTMISSSVELLKDKRKLPEHLKYYNDQIEDAMHKIQFYTEQYKEDIAQRDLSLKDVNLKKKQEIMAAVQNIMKKRAIQKKRILDELADLRSERDRLSKRADAREVWQESIIEARSPVIGVLGQTKKVFKYPLQDPFTDVKEEFLEGEGVYSRIVSSSKIGVSKGRVIGAGVFGVVGCLGGSVAGLMVPCATGIGGTAGQLAGQVVGSVGGSLVGGAVGGIGGGTIEVSNYVLQHFLCYLSEKDSRGVFLNKKVNIDTKIYESTYLSRMGMSGAAKVTLSCVYNKIPDVIQHIHEIEALIENKQKMLQELSTSDQESLAHIQPMGSHSQTVENAELTEIKRKQQENEERLLSFIDRKQMLENSCFLVNLRMDRVRKKYDDLADLLLVLSDVTELLDFDESTLSIYRFQRLYAHQSELDNRLGEKKTDMLKILHLDFMSLYPTIDPIQLSCGHSFNTVEIKEWFNLNDVNVCPLCQKESSARFPVVV